MDKAIEKINGEMQRHPDDKLWEFVGTYIIDSMNEKKAELINKSHSLNEAIKRVTSEAKKVAVNSCGVLTPDSVITAVDLYFGAERNPAAYESAARLLMGEAPKKEEKKPFVDVDFDSMFG